MRLFGQLTEFVRLVFRQSNGNQITIEPSADVASAGDVTVVLPPIASGTTNLVDTNSVQVLFNKEIDASTTTTVGAFTHGAQVDNPTSNVHGVVGNIVGTSDTQTLSGKSLDANANTITGLRHGTEVDNSPSGVHGVIGNVVGTSDTQELTNKSIVEQIARGFITVEERADDPAAPAAGFVKVYRKAAGLFFIESDGTVCQIESSTPPNVEDLTNVNITSPIQNNILLYNATSQTWVNADLENSIDLNSLRDVDSATTPNNGQILQYSSSFNSWLNQDLVISEAVDTSISNPQPGNSLRYDGTDWSNRTPTYTKSGTVSGFSEITSSGFSVLPSFPNVSVTFRNRPVMVRITAQNRVIDSWIQVAANQFAFSGGGGTATGEGNFRLRDVTGGSTLGIQRLRYSHDFNGNATVQRHFVPSSTVSFVIPPNQFAFGSTRTLRIEGQKVNGQVFMNNVAIEVIEL